MKDIAHRDLDSSSTAGFRRRELETSSRVIRDEGENLCGVILSSLGARAGTSIFENNGFPSSYQRCKIVRATGIDLYV